MHRFKFLKWFIYAAFCYREAKNRGTLSAPRAEFEDTDTVSPSR